MILLQTGKPKSSTELPNGSTTPIIQSAFFPTSPTSEIFCTKKTPGSSHQPALPCVGQRIVITSTTTNDWATCKRFPVYSIDTPADPAEPKFYGKSFEVRPPSETPFLFFDLDSEPEQVPTRFRLSALFDSREERIEFSEIEFALQANYSVMVYQPVGDPTPDQVWGTVPHGALTSGDRFSLVASLAFAAVAQRYLPGFLAFGFPLGFSIDPAIGKLVFLIIQPATGGGTASEALRAVLTDPSLRRVLLAEFVDTLRRTKQGFPSLPVPRNATTIRCSVMT